jgi:hypothetical protein
MTCILVEHEGEELTAYKYINCTRLTYHTTDNCKPVLDIPTAMLDKLAVAWCSSRGLILQEKPVTAENLAALIHDACLAEEMFEPDELLPQKVVPVQEL